MGTKEQRSKKTKKQKNFLLNPISIHTILSFILKSNRYWGISKDEEIGKKRKLIAKKNYLN